MAYNDDGFINWDQEQTTYFPVAYQDPVSFSSYERYGVDTNFDTYNFSVFNEPKSVDYGYDYDYNIDYDYKDCYNYDYDYGNAHNWYSSSDPTINYFAHSYIKPKLISYEPSACDTNHYVSYHTQYSISYSQEDSGFNEPEFEEYDPTPYGGGYDILSVYGKPLPPSDQTCYPRSKPKPIGPMPTPSSTSQPEPTPMSIVTPIPLDGKEPKLDPLPIPIATPIPAVRLEPKLKPPIPNPLVEPKLESMPMPIATPIPLVDPKPKLESEFESVSESESNSDSEPELEPDPLELKKVGEREMGKYSYSGHEYDYPWPEYDHNTNATGVGYDYGYGYGKQVVQVPPYEYSPEVVDLCESIFGSWPCLARIRKQQMRQDNKPGTSGHEHRHHSPWEDCAGYIFGHPVASNNV
ncbi:hypothetical protein R6Q59_027334 [Mikania micrantha]